MQWSSNGFCFWSIFFLSFFYNFFLCRWPRAFWFGQRPEMRETLNMMANNLKSARPEERSALIPNEENNYSLIQIILPKDMEY